MARTNKMGILKQKQQVAKQKKMLGDTSFSHEDERGMKSEYTNPKDNRYLFFKRSGKWICDMTNCREDPDGYRLVGKPNSGEVEHIYKGTSSRGFKRYMRSSLKTKITKNVTHIIFIQINVFYMNFPKIINIATNQKKLTNLFSIFHLHNYLVVSPIKIFINRKTLITA